MKLLSKAGIWLARKSPRGYWRIARFIAHRDPALWSLPLPLRFAPGNSLIADLREPVFAQFLHAGCCIAQAGEDQLVMRLLRPGDVVYDVGANIGYTSLLYAHCVSPRGGVIAIEPSPSAFFFLNRTIAGEPAIKAMNVALSDKAGTLPFYETMTLDTSSLEPIPGIDPVDVRVLTFDQVAENNPKPTFVKVDVEGNEPAVFRGMAASLGGEHPPVIFYEALSADAAAKTLEILRALIKVPFQTYRISRSGALLKCWDPTGNNNYLTVPANQAWRLEGVPHPEPEVNRSPVLDTHRQWPI